jgi:hypothetical protein
MCQKIRCDGESEKFCKFFWELNRALVCCEKFRFAETDGTFATPARRPGCARGLQLAMLVVVARERD